MGGKEAKIRRKLQRQSIDRSAHEGFTKERPVIPTLARGTHEESHHSVLHSTTSNNITSKPKNIPVFKKGKKKVIKPKHLKRKLHDASAQNERQRLSDELRAWEEAKRQSRAEASTDPKTNHNDDKKESIMSLVFPPDGMDPPHQELPDNSLPPEAALVSQPEEPTDNDDDGDDDDDPPQSLRQRGKRRRGKKDTEQHVHDEEEAPAAPSRPSKTPRRCHGRRPVTDFVVGRTYTGTVVSVKPYGVFFDLGCHSDAFCHVSRLCDDRVASPELLFPPGAVVDTVRVVELNRARKQITVSLQSAAMRERELASGAARQQRRRASPAKRTPPITTTASQNSTSSIVVAEQKNVDDFEDSHTFFDQHNKDMEETSRVSLKRPIPLDEPNNPLVQNNEMTTPAELKRARKLARRADRRAVAY
jgi:predicted RNA-binding protein with RPS1 domain